MKLRHFETLSPLCPVCRSSRDESHHLIVSSTSHQTNDDIVEGRLSCPNSACQSEFPIIDGIPVIVRNVRDFVASSIHQITARNDLCDKTESLLGDCCGAGSEFDTTRQHLSTYAWDHYGDLDPDESSPDLKPGSLADILENALGLIEQPIIGPIIDIGCSVGRISLELARRTHHLVLGVDLNYAMLRVGAQILRTRTACYPRRRVGTVYDRRSFRVELDEMDSVDFWACDATALPFGSESFGMATSFNLIDCVHSPVDHLTELGRMLMPGGLSLMATPYDWAPSATAMESWLGGHSQRSDSGGASEPMIRSLFTPGAHPYSVLGMELTGEIADLPWHVRMHDRSTMLYKVHVLAAAKTSADSK